MNIKRQIRVNNAIRVPQVRVIDPEGKQIGILPIEEALRQAQAAGLDLVELAPDANPPVCKIIDFKKYLYEQKRKERQARKSSRASELKEVKFRLTIDKHDYEIKLRHIREFLEEGYKVKVTFIYRGREKAHLEFGERLANQIIKDLENVAQIDHTAISEKRIDSIIFSRKK